MPPYGYVVGAIIIALVAVLTYKVFFAAALIL
jgi:hypothetical protein